MGLTHFDDAPAREYELGHLRGRWTMLGDAAGCEAVGVRRIQLPADGWSTPAHDHGRSEEIFYVLAGTGVSWQRGATAPICAGDCIVYHPRGGEHTLHADASLDVLAFGTREHDEALRLPRLDMSIVGSRAVASEPAVVPGRGPIQHVREAELGPPPLPSPSSPPAPRPSTIVNLADAEPARVEHGRIARVRRNLGRVAGSRVAGLQHVTVDPGRESAPPHCHSVQEEIFVILEGEGVLVLGDRDETPVRPGHVVSRPAATRVSHMFRAGNATALTYLAYGTRDASDICFYQRSGKIAIHGVGVIGRIEPVDYWEGEG